MINYVIQRGRSKYNKKVNQKSLQHRDIVQQTYFHFQARHSRLELPCYRGGGGGGVRA